MVPARIYPVLQPKSSNRKVNHLNPEVIVQIKAFIQGAVYCWVKNRKNEQFSVRDLFGGENFEWNGTPLIHLYEKHANMFKKEHEAAMKDAAKDLGCLLKDVLITDKRTFTKDDAGFTAGYTWVGDEP
ncbi:hypothetical protein JD969_10330 [Planctomycetota bacterium]|nr:hypothetical protein JD969_10330 [Planctomycetota bacterium]